METQWFPASKEPQDTETIKQDVGVCILGQRWNLVVDYLEKGATIVAKHFVAFLDNLKQQLVSKHRDKLLTGILLLLTRRPLRTRNWQIFTLKF
jgi:hypothetical protein